MMMHPNLTVWKIDQFGSNRYDAIFGIDHVGSTLMAFGSTQGYFYANSKVGLTGTERDFLFVQWDPCQSRLELQAFGCMGCPMDDPQNAPTCGECPKQTYSSFGYLCDDCQINYGLTNQSTCYFTGLTLQSFQPTVGPIIGNTSLTVELTWFSEPFDQNDTLWFSNGTHQAPLSCQYTGRVANCSTPSFLSVGNVTLVPNTTQPSIHIPDVFDYSLQSLDSVNYHGVPQAVASDVTLRATGLSLRDTSLTRVRLYRPEAIYSPSITSFVNSTQIDIQVPSGINPAVYDVQVTVDGQQYQTLSGHTITVFNTSTLALDSSQYSLRTGGSNISLVTAHFPSTVDFPLLRFMPISVNGINRLVNPVIVSPSHLLATVPFFSDLPINVSTLASVQLALSPNDGRYFIPQTQTIFVYNSHGLGPLSPDTMPVPVDGSNTTISLVPDQSLYFTYTDSALILAAVSANGNNTRQVLQATYQSSTKIDVQLPAEITQPGDMFVEITLNGHQFSHTRKMTFFNMTSVFPDILPSDVSTTITVTGEGFTNTGSSMRCTFTDSTSQAHTSVPASFVSASQMTCASPQMTPGDYVVTVTTNGQNYTVNSVSNTLVYQLPTLVSVSPAVIASSLAQQVTIIGTNFTSQDNIMVRFGNIDVPGEFLSNTSIRCQLPSMAVGSYTIQLSYNNGTILHARMPTNVELQVVAPAVSSVLPASVHLSGGFTLTIGGSGFVASSVPNSLRVNISSSSLPQGKILNATINSPTELLIEAPSFASLKQQLGLTHPSSIHQMQVQVTTNAGDSYSTDSASLLLYSTPVLNRTTIGSAVATVGLAYSLFGEFASLASIKLQFNSTDGWSSDPLTPTLTENKELAITTPVIPDGVPKPVNATVHIAINGVHFSFTGFAVLFYTQPTITALSLTAGPNLYATPVTVIGTNFIEVPDASLWSFNVNTKSNCQFVTSTNMLCDTPTLPETLASVELSLNGLQFTSGSGLQYRTLAPAITAISPSAGPETGNTRVTITGTNFLQIPGVTTSLRVRLSSASVSPPLLLNATVVTTTKLTLKSPSFANFSLGLNSPATTHEINVEITTNGGGSFSANNKKFVVQAIPSFDSISPTTGPSSGGTTLSIVGGFATAVDPIKALFNDSHWTSDPVSVTQVSNTLLTLTTPAIPNNITGPESFSLRIALNGQDFYRLPQTFSFHEAVTMTKFSTTVGPTLYATPVFVHGSNFIDVSSAYWSLGGTLGPCVFINSTLMKCFTPLLPVTTANVEFSLNGVDFTNYGSTFQFRTFEPVISAHTPKGGPVSGDTVMTIRGSGLLATDNLGSLLLRLSSAIINPPIVINVTDTLVSGTEIKVTTPTFTGYPLNIGSPAATHSVSMEISSNGGVNYYGENIRFGLYIPSTFSQVTPSSGFETGGTAVSIHGMFPQTGDAVLVRFNNTGFTSAGVGATLLSSTRLTLTSPSVTGSGVTRPFIADIAVAVNGQNYFMVPPSLTFVFFRAVTITSISITRGPVGLATPIVVYGTNFVLLNTIKASFGIGIANQVPCTFQTGTSVSCVTPQLPTTTTEVELSLNGVEFSSSSGVNYRTALPALQRIEPLSANVNGGTLVTIHGTDLLTDFVAAGSQARLSSAIINPPIYLNISSNPARTQVVMELPSMVAYPHGLNDPSSIHHDIGLEVTTNARSTFTSSGLSIRLFAPPVFNGTFPVSGPSSGGTTISIVGTFAKTADVPKVRFNSSLWTSDPVSAVFVTTTLMRVSSPAVSGGVAMPLQVNFQIALNGRDFVNLNDSMSFKFYTPITATGVSVTRGPALCRTPITVYGTNFLDIDTAMVSFNGNMRGPCVFQTSTAMRCTTPELPVTTAELEVSLNGVQFTGGSAILYSTLVPLLIGHSPNAAPPRQSTVLYLTGSNLINTTIPDSLRIKFTSTANPTGVEVIPTVITATSMLLNTPVFADEGFSSGIYADWTAHQVTVSVTTNAGSSYFASGQKLEVFRENGFNKTVPSGSPFSGETVIRLLGNHVEVTDGGLVRLRDPDNQVTEEVSVLRRATYVQFTTPQYTGVNEPRVMTVEYANNGKDFHATNQSLMYYPAFTVNGVDPVRKTPTLNSAITISGTGFVDTGESVRVELGTGNVMPILSVNSTHIIVFSSNEHVEGDHRIRISFDGGQQFTVSPDVLFKVRYKTFNCPLNTEFYTATPKFITDCLCKANYYTDVQLPGVACKECPENAICAGQMAWPVPQPGFFQTGNTQFTRCALLESCLGGNTSTCLLGHTGRLCGQCIRGYHHLGDRCLVCPEQKYTAFILLGMFFLTYLFWARREVRRSLQNRGGDIVSLSVAHLQVLSTFADYRLNWPDAVKSVFDLFSVTNLSLDAAAPECSILAWDFEIGFWATMFSPVILVLGLMFRIALEHGRGALVNKHGLAFEEKYPNFCAVPDPHLSNVQYVLHSVRYAFARLFIEPPEPMITTWKYLVNEIMLTLALMYIVLCKRVLQVFDCNDVGGGLIILDAVPDEACWVEGGMHMRLVGPATMFLMIYVGGIPLLFFLVMRYGREEKTRKDDLFAHMFSVITVKYKVRFFWYECAILMRKLAIVCVNLFATSLPSLQGLLGITVLGISTVIQFAFKPFRTRAQNILEGLLLSLSVALLLSGMVYVTGTLDGLQASIEVAWTLVTTIAAFGALALSVLFLLRDQYMTIVKRNRFTHRRGSVVKRMTNVYGNMRVLVEEDHALRLRRAIEDEFVEDAAKGVHMAYEEMLEKHEDMDDFDYTVHDLSTLVQRTVKESERTKVLAFLLNESNDPTARREVQRSLEAVDPERGRVLAEQEERTAIREGKNTKRNTSNLKRLAQLLSGAKSSENYRMSASSSGQKDVESAMSTSSSRTASARRSRSKNRLKNSKSTDDLDSFEVSAELTPVEVLKKAKTEVSNSDSDSDDVVPSLRVVRQSRGRKTRRKAPRRKVLNMQSDDEGSGRKSVVDISNLDDEISSPAPNLRAPRRGKRKFNRSKKSRGKVQETRTQPTLSTESSNSSNGSVIVHQTLLDELNEMEEVEELEMEEML
eukprot:TRINITY_DN734_c0_g1_i8.p1 TRINITY_DN734_c0_g1~~TRINITY_DN734_c0_g1_i8.p1  ORF type:complete len:3035 (+),score=741.47 TRINITY_DN734_c0_g1_i8:1217-10321(+)